MTLLSVSAVTAALDTCARCPPIRNALIRHSLCKAPISSFVAEIETLPPMVSRASASRAQPVLHVSAFGLLNISHHRI